MRKAIGLIELIVAIVIMAIAFSAVPIVMGTAAENLKTAMQQEAVSIATAQIVTISKLQWDEAETNATKNGGYAKIVDIDDNESYGRYGGTIYRIGALTMGANKGQYRRKFYNSYTPASSTLGPETGESGPESYDDVDDYNGFTIDLNETGRTGYKFPYQGSVSVAYRKSTLGASTGSGAVKFITVTITNAQNDVNVTMKSFVCNIGETKILARVVP